MKTTPSKCPECGFVAKSKPGLGAHRVIHFNRRSPDFEHIPIYGDDVTEEQVRDPPEGS